MFVHSSKHLRPADVSRTMKEKLMMTKTHTCSATAAASPFPLSDETKTNLSFISCRNRDTETLQSFEANYFSAQKENFEQFSLTVLDNNTKLNIERPLLPLQQSLQQREQPRG